MLRKIKFKRTKFDADFRDNLKRMYDTDKVLLSTYHKSAPTTAGMASVHTMHDLHNLLKMNVKVKAYYIQLDGIINGDVVYGGNAGYVVYAIDDAGKYYVLAYFIMIEYRSLANEIFDYIEKRVTAPQVFMSLYAKNTRAISFAKKRGYDVVNYNYDTISKQKGVLLVKKLNKNE